MHEIAMLIYNVFLEEIMMDARLRLSLRFLYCNFLALLNIKTYVDQWSGVLAGVLTLIYISSIKIILSNPYTCQIYGNVWLQHMAHLLLFSGYLKYNN